ncbi:restriction endonuclease subunit S [Streptococcus sp. ZJ100]
MRKLEDDFIKAGGEWREYRIIDIFEVKNTHNILSSWITENSGLIPYVTASQNNNSVSTYIDYDEAMLDEGNSIFIGGKTLVISYQDRDYFSNDSHNLALYLKDEKHRTKLIQLYMVSALYKSLKPLYSWGNSISKQKI